MARTRWLDRFTFGGRVPGAVGLVLAVTVVSSIVVAFGSRHTTPPLLELVSLVPARVFRGEVWRLVTWGFVETSPIGLLFSCLFLYWFAKDLADAWGSLRFLRIYGTILLVASVGTCLVALVDRDAYGAFFIGDWAMTAAMTVAWGLYFPDREIRFWFILPLRGVVIAWLTVIVTVLYAIYSGWEHFLPVLIAEAAMLAWLFRRSLGARFEGIKKAVRPPPKRRPVSSTGKVVRLSDYDTRRRSSEAVLRSIEEKDDDLAPLPKEIADVLGGKKKDEDRE